MSKDDLGTSSDLDGSVEELAMGAHGIVVPPEQDPVSPG
jgi:hypothetical protein